MFDVERDIRKAKAGAGDDLVYKNITGFKADLTVESKPNILKVESGKDSKTSLNAPSGENSDSNGIFHVLPV